MQKKISMILVVMFFGLILVFLNSQGSLNSAFDIYSQITSPVSTLFSKAGSGISDFFGSLLNVGSLQKENAWLEEKVNKLEAEVVNLKDAKEENESLKKDLKFISEKKIDYESASVIAYEPSNLRGMITINKGLKNNIKEGKAVVFEGFLIGRISEVGEEYSKIQLITDPTSAIPVAIQNSNTKGIAKGELGSGLIIEKVPQGEKIEEGDTVVTSGLGGELPRGIILGKVENIERKENSLFSNAKIRPQVDLTHILRVLVIK